MNKPEIDLIIIETIKSYEIDKEYNQEADITDLLIKLNLEDKQHLVLYTFKKVVRNFSFANRVLFMIANEFPERVYKLCDHYYGAYLKHSPL